MDPSEILPIELWIMIAEYIPTFYEDCIGFITTCKTFRDIHQYLGFISLHSQTIDDVGLRFFTNYSHVFIPNCFKITSYGLIPLLANITVLDISMNNINLAIPYEILKDACNLKELYCHTCNVDIANFPNHIEKLILSGCNIKYSKLHIQTFPNLKYLDLSFSHFDKLNWMRFPKLEHVNIIKLRTPATCLDVFENIQVAEAYIKALIVDKMDGKLISGISKITFYPPKKYYKICSLINIEEFYIEIEHISKKLHKYPNLKKVKCKIWK